MEAKTSQIMAFHGGERSHYSAKELWASLVRILRADNILFGHSLRSKPYSKGIAYHASPLVFSRLSAVFLEQHSRHSGLVLPVA